MLFVLLEVAGEIAIDELRRNPAVRVLWVEPAPTAASKPAGQKPALRPLLVEPCNEQALELLRQLEKLGILRILLNDSAIT